MLSALGILAIVFSAILSIVRNVTAQSDFTKLVVQQVANHLLFPSLLAAASRMESNSEENRIHCSRESRKLLKEQFPELPMRSRGKINVKGKGEMHTYWVNEEAGVQRPSELLKQMDSALLGSSAQARRKALEAVDEGHSDDCMSMSFRLDDEELGIVETVQNPPSVAEATPEVTTYPFQNTSHSPPELDLDAPQDSTPNIDAREWARNDNPDETLEKRLSSYLKPSHAPNLLFL
jgi:hypothetical protein